MGQTSSSTTESENELPSRSHYDLLEIPTTASEDDIKKAYRRKALELHPDRNHGREEAATALFAEIQAAHSVLSDPQERAWYDAHQAEFVSGYGPADGEAHYERSVKVTTAEDIRSMCASRTSTFSDFSDSSKGFFTNVRELFERLAMEERISSINADLEPVDYPSFGSSRDEFQDVVKSFYSVWGGFSTTKTFAWKDQYRPSPEYDRRTRRAMEKENQKARDDAVRDFNDAVRTLVLFVRRRDPRYVATSTTDAERQKAMREAAAAQAARARKANAQKLAEQAIPDWAQSQGDQEGDDSATGEEDEDEFEETEPAPEIWECIFCSKTFKSEGQHDAHERSKKHKQTVAKLEREMRAQNKALGLQPELSIHQEEVQPLDGSMSDEVEDLSTDMQEKQLHDAATEEDELSPEVLSVAGSPTQKSTKEATPPASESPIESSDEDDDSYGPRSQVESRLFKNQDDSIAVPSNPENEAAKDDADRDTSQIPKLGKAKEKRAKRAARNQAKDVARSQVGNTSGSEGGLECAACKDVFASKNKLFDHIKRTGHARPPAEIDKGAGRKAKKA